MTVTVNFLVAIQAALISAAPAHVRPAILQFENLNPFPVFSDPGRNGGVRFVHSVYPSPSSGPFHKESYGEIERQVEPLLSELQRS